MVLLIKSFKIASKTCLDNQQTCFFPTESIIILSFCMSCWAIANLRCQRFEHLLVPFDTWGPSFWPSSGDVDLIWTFWDHIWDELVDLYLCQLCGCSPEKKAAHVHPHLFPPCERQQHLWLLRYNPTVSWVTNKLAHPRCQLLPERPTCHRNTVAGGLGGEGLRDETWNYCWFSGRTDKLYRNLT